MKRPQGFDSKASGRGSDESHQPVVVPSPVAHQNRVGGSNPASAAKPISAPAVPRRGLKTAQEVSVAASARSPAVSRPTDASSAAAPGKAARRALVKASGARRRFERVEARRFTRRSRRRKLTWVTSLITLVVLVGGVTGAVYSPLLSLKTIRIEGASKVSAADIRVAVAGQLGTPLALVDTGAIRSAIARFPLIRSFVTETLPPDTLVIRIAERVPMGTLATASGFSVVDPAGVVLDSSANRTPGLPLIDLGSATTSGPAFTSAVAVLISLPTKLAGQVDTVSAQTSDDVTLTLSGGKVVVWGSSEKTELKARVLAAMVSAAASSSAVKYDVSAPTHPVFAKG